MAEKLGTSGDDILIGTEGADQFNSLGGNDLIIGLGGDDDAVVDLATDGADDVDLGEGSDMVRVVSPPGQVRLTFTSVEVGDGSARDRGDMTNQDDGLAVRLQREDGSDAIVGPVSRYDDEGITFAGGTGVTFDVRDLVSGLQRGDDFKEVRLGTNASDQIIIDPDAGGEALTAALAADGRGNYYINGGMGDDLLIANDGADFLVGGAGADRLRGGTGDDRLSGGADRDIFEFNGFGNDGNDVILDFQKNDVLLFDNERLRDLNNDGIIGFGRDGVLDIDPVEGDGTITFAGTGQVTALRFLGKVQFGEVDPFFEYYYGDAATRPTGALEGVLENDTLTGRTGEQVFFYDTALGLDFGDDQITSFGSEDLFITTAALFDADGDGRIDFGRDRTLNLDDGTSVMINNGQIRGLEFDGSVAMNGVTYFVYSRIGSTGTNVDDLLD